MHMNFIIKNISFDFTILVPRIVSSFRAHASLLVRTNLKACLVDFVNTTKKALYNFYGSSRTVGQINIIIIIIITSTEVIRTHILVYFLYLQF
jgi:hypothetical protein